MVMELINMSALSIKDFSKSILTLSANPVGARYVKNGYTNDSTRNSRVPMVLCQMLLVFLTSSMSQSTSEVDLAISLWHDAIIFRNLDIEKGLSTSGSSSAESASA